MLRLGDPAAAGEPFGRAIVATLTPGPYVSWKRAREAGGVRARRPRANWKAG